VQKATYFLKTLTGVPMDFDFILYKHGPFSFDLRDELTAMRADGLLSMRPHFPYGPTLEMTEQGKNLMKKFPVTLKKYKENMDFVVNELDDKGVSELERLATALFIIKNEPSRRTQNARADRIHELKPHVSVTEAKTAVSAVQEMISRYATHSG
jgi:uncharacterized protein YwgA